MPIINSLRDPLQLRIRSATAPRPASALVARNHGELTGWMFVHLVPRGRGLRIPRNSLRQKYVTEYVICRMESSLPLPYC